MNFIIVIIVVVIYIHLSVSCTSHPIRHAITPLIILTLIILFVYHSAILIINYSISIIFHITNCFFLFITYF